MNILKKDGSIDARDLIDGAVLVVDKPLTWTSFDVVNKVRYAIKHALGVKKVKVGHAGTLDPLATGVVILCVGKMTKQIDGIMAQDKKYSGTMKLGYTTPSYDAESSEEFVADPMHLVSEQVKRSADAFVGEIKQYPPIFSAIKKDGKKLYEFARKGIEVEVESRAVYIHSFEITTIDLPIVGFNVVCSKGTYIRSLVNDYGAKLGVGAYLTGLRRDASGSFQIEDAWELDKLIAEINTIQRPDQ